MIESSIDELKIGYNEKRHDVVRMRLIIQGQLKLGARTQTIGVLIPNTNMSCSFKQQTDIEALG